MIKRLLLLVCAVFALVAPAHAALDGWDNKPGDPCTAAEEGHTRRNASADLDGSQITLICDGSQWQSAGDGLAALQGQDDSGPCTLEKDGLIRYRTSGDPHWEYCHGGTTSWLPFRLPQCQDDDAGACTLAALRSSNDPQFKASSIRCGDKLLGVTGTYGNGSSSAFTFTDVTNAALSTLTTASAVTISGIPAGCPAEVVVSGQGSPQVSVNGGAWGTSSSIANGQTLAVRLTSSANFSTAHTATIAIGSTEDNWSVTTLAADTTPNAFTFTDQTNVALSTLTTSNTITISGINTTTPVSVTGTGAQISINGGAWVTSGTITNGQTLAVRLTSSAAFSTAMTATVNVGGVSDNWSVTTLPADTTPNAFTFTDATGQALSTLITSNTVTIGGINTGTPVSVSGSGSPKISINGGAWVTSGTITNGQTLRVQLTSSGSFSTALSATVNVGGVTDSWSVTTRAANSCTVASGTTWAVSGKSCTTPSVLTISHGSSGSRTDSTEPTTGSATWSCNDGTPTLQGGATCVESCAASQTVNWPTSCTASSGALLANAASRTITNTATGYSGTRSITCNNGTLAQSGGSCTGTDSTPNAFTFTDQTGVALNTLITSDTITISGLTTGASVSVSGTGSPQISINGGAWVTSGTIQNGQTLRVRLTSANAASTARSATVNVGGVTDAWSVTTTAPITIFLTSGTSWSVPANWNSTNNKIEVIGGGGGGGVGRRGGAAGTGGGGGAYSRITNLALTPGASVTYSVGGGGSGKSRSSDGATAGDPGGDTYFCNSSSNCTSIGGGAVVVGAKGGGGGNGATSGTASGASGGAAASGLGSLKYSGGGSGSITVKNTKPTSGGGGAAGPNGNGGNSPGGFTNGGSHPGGTGDAGNTAAGANGTQFDATHGSGGGGNGDGGGTSPIAGSGGQYGAGGGGVAAANGTPTSGNGAPGLIVITYTP